MYCRPTNHRAKRDSSSLHSAKRCHLMVLQRSRRSSSPPPTPTHFHTCRKGQSRSARKIQPAPSALDRTWTRLRNSPAAT